MKLAVSEVFYSIQGEGITMGIPAVFVRLSGCNLMCGGMGTQFDNALHNGATWRCDTIEVWMKGSAKDLQDVLPEDCVTALRNGAHLVITGGEPIMQEKAVIKFIQYCRDYIHPDIFVEIETNGSKTPSLDLAVQVNLFNCSPKLSNSGNEVSMRYNPKALAALEMYQSELLECDVIFKFVVATEEDWWEIVRDYLPHIDRRNVVLMPAGENQELLLLTKQKVAELAIKEHLKFCTRLHIEIWNQKTGV